MFKVFTTETFDKKVAKLPSEQQENITKISISLSKNPHVGRPLSVSFLREKRIKDKRVYFLVYDNVVLLVAISNKKNQQDTIDTIKGSLEDLREFVKRLV